MYINIRRYKLKVLLNSLF